jgi:hypothetical protein
MFNVEIWNDDMDFFLTDQPFIISKWARENCPSFKEYDSFKKEDMKYTDQDTMFQEKYP